MSAAESMTSVADVITTQRKRHKIQKKDYGRIGSLPVIDQGAVEVRQCPAFGKHRREQHFFFG